MPRIPKPHRHGAWFVTEADVPGKGPGRFTRLCKVQDGLGTAHEVLDRLLRQRGALLTVSELVERCLRHTRLTRKELTVKDYEFYLGWLVKHCGAIPAGCLTLTDGYNFLSGLKTRIPPLTPVSINHALRAAKRCLNLAVEFSWLPSNPWKTIRLLPETGRKRILSVKEFDRLVEFCGRGITSTRFCLVAMVKVLRETALRPSECRLLRWEWVHLDQHLIVIPEDSHKTSGRTRTSRPRTIPLTQKVEEILLEWHQRRGSPGVGWVFPGPGGVKPWGPGAFSRKFRTAADRAGLPKDVVPYTLRHTRLTEVGTVEKWDFSLVQLLAGHTKAEQTQRYIHPQADLLVRAAQEGELRRIQGSSFHSPDTRSQALQIDPSSGTDSQKQESPFS